MKVYSYGLYFKFRDYKLGQRSVEGGQCLGKVDKRLSVEDIYLFSRCLLCTFLVLDFELGVGRRQVVEQRF